jgi:GNAT superfamily N-acetyltransferase
MIITRGNAHLADRLPGFVATDKERPVGLVTYEIGNGQCEIVTLNSLIERKGIGSALIGSVLQEAVTARCRRLWLVTTNDNTPALRFYQKLGFTIKALHPNAIAESRRLKPEIPEFGIDGIPIRDEIELEIMLGNSSASIR